MNTENRKVLIVENVSITRHALTRDLKNLGFTVQSAATGEGGLAKYKEFTPDIVLMDILLVGVLNNGIDVADHIQRYKKCCLLYFTGTRGQVESMTKTIFHGFIRKPYDIEFLGDEIEMAWAKYLKEEEGKEKTIKITYIDKDTGIVKEPVPLKNIVFIELISSLKHLKLYLENGTIKSGGTYSNFSKFLNELNSPNIQQVHQSFAINLSFCPRIQGQYIIFENIEHIPIKVSRSFMPSLKNRIQNG